MNWSKAQGQADILREQLGIALDAPADVVHICKLLNIELLFENIPGFAGNLIVAGNRQIIGVSTNISNKAWQNFTVAHELGHYCLHAADNGTYHEQDTFESLNDWSYVEREKEANQFAAELLLPQLAIQKKMKTSTFNWQTLETIANDYGASLRATARRWVELSDEATAFVVTKGNQLCWAAYSSIFSGARIFPTGLEPMVSTTGTYACSDWDTVEANQWIEDRNDIDTSADLHVTSRGPDRIGQVLSLLWDESGQIFDPNQDDED